jgi:ribonuclease P protein component
MEQRLRLRESYDIQHTRSRGQSAASGPLVARILPNRLEPAQNRYTVVAGKRVGKAHDRNRCKRLTREAIRLLDPQLEQGYDVVLIVRGGPQELTGLDAASVSLREIFRKARLLPREDSHA